MFRLFRCRSGIHCWQSGLEKEKFIPDSKPFQWPMVHHCSQWKTRHGCCGQRKKFHQRNKVTSKIHKDVIYFPILLQMESLVGSIKSQTVLHTTPTQANIPSMPIKHDFFLYTLALHFSERNNLSPSVSVTLKTFSMQVFWVFLRLLYMSHEHKYFVLDIQHTN